MFVAIAQHLQRQPRFLVILEESPLELIEFWRKFVCLKYVPKYTQKKVCMDVVDYYLISRKDLKQYWSQRSIIWDAQRLEFTGFLMY